jgi:hypothetical protein
MENQLPNFPVPSQNYIAPNLTPMPVPGGGKTSSFRINKKLSLSILVIFLLIGLPIGAYFLGQQQGQAIKTARLAKDMNSVNITPPAPTATPTPTPILAPIATNSGTLVATNTATWNTYTNAKYAYSIQYPDNWNSQLAEKTGSAFASSVVLNNSGSPEIKINAIAKISDSSNLSFADYVQVAGIKEFGYSKLATIKPITTASGLSGYETTWVTSANGQTSTTLPITYFEIPSDKTATIEVFLYNAVDTNTYETMVSTFKFTQ